MKSMDDVQKGYSLPHKKFIGAEKAPSLTGARGALLRRAAEGTI
jgi:hypothetical protein